MRAIIVDDEIIMLNSFQRLSSGIPDLTIVGAFDNPEEAYRFAQANPVDIAFLDVKMPRMNGIELAGALRELRPDILIVFISAYDEYIRDSNRIGGDYYIVKPYKTETLEIAMDRIRLLAKRQKRIYTSGLSEGFPFL
ncbi:MAG: response regulator [Oscillospiraceae bacterium]|nr:response regulator [Oscillospiraceae bacterium]